MLHHWLRRKFFFLLIFLTAATSVFSEETGTVLMDFERRVSALEEIVHELTGRIEELQHALQKTQSAEGSLSSPSVSPSSGLSVGTSAAIAGSTAASTLGAAHDGIPSSSPFSQVRGETSSEGTGTPLLLEREEKPKNAQEMYDTARKFLNRGAYEEAEAAFKAFIVHYKKSPLALNAHYWLGETYYGRQDYARSSVAFMEAYKAYKAQGKTGDLGNNFSKAPESLIKLIFSLRGMGKKANACATYKQLGKEFPKLSSNLERLAVRSIEGLKCS